MTCDYEMHRKIILSRFQMQALFQDKIRQDFQHTVRATSTQAVPKKPHPILLYNSLPPDSIVSHSFTLFMTHFNIILLPIPKSSKLFSVGSPTKALPAFLTSPGILNWVTASITEFKLLSVTSQMQFCYGRRSQTLQLYTDSEGVITYFCTVTSSSISLTMYCF